MARPPKPVVPDNGRKAVAVGVLAGTAVVVALMGRAFGSVRAHAGEAVNAKGLAAALPYVKKWTGVFKAATPLMVLTVLRLESNFNPLEENHTARAEAGGGAWGPMQVLATTAQDVYTALLKSKDPQVAAALKGYAEARDLLGFDLGVLFGVYYLDKLARRFGGDFDMVVAAYQSGPGPVERALAEGKPYDAHLGPYGRQYVELANKFRTQVQAYA